MKPQAANVPTLAHLRINDSNLLEPSFCLVTV